MAFVAFALRRPTALLRMPEAIARGMSPSAFIKQLTGLGLSYRRTTMLADWRSAAQVEAKKDTLKYVRKDRLPTLREYAETEWPWKEEFAYKLRVHSRLSPGEPLIERFVIIESDKPLTPGAMEQEVRSRWAEREFDYPEQLEKVVPISAFRRTELPFEED